MNILGSKIYLRALEEEDSGMLLELINDPETEKMLGGWSFPVSAAEQEQWFKGLERDVSTLRCAVVPHGEKGAVGTVVLSEIDYKNASAQVHIKLAKGSGRRKGYGRDAIKAVLRYAFEELRLNCVYAQVLPDNELSRKLFERSGFREEGILRERLYKNGGFQDVCVYSILRKEYRHEA